ncbi:hypothetical protein BvCmsKSP050_00773 [Escherichia coli]|nr:hypothetical protein BvCmsKSP050_00773 [Escherichia coli]
MSSFTCKRNRQRLPQLTVQELQTAFSSTGASAARTIWENGRVKALLASARLPSAEVFIRLLRLISAFMSASVVWIFIITHLLLFKQNVMPEFMVVVGYIFSISTRLVCCGFPFASGEGRRVVSVFTQPPWSILSPDILASCQAPWPIALTPGRIRGVTLAGSRTSPRWLNTRTISPLAIPRFCASIGLIHTS